MLINPCITESLVLCLPTKTPQKGYICLSHKKPCKYDFIVLTFKDLLLVISLVSIQSN